MFTKTQVILYQEHFHFLYFLIQFSIIYIQIYKVLLIRI